MYILEINQKAESEIDKIGHWYDKRVPGLSFRFYDDLDKSIKSISTHPLHLAITMLKEKSGNAPLAVSLIKFIITSANALFIFWRLFILKGHRVTQEGISADTFHLSVSFPYFATY